MRVKNSEAFEVMINGKFNILGLVYNSSNGFQYNTLRNESSHIFKDRLIPGSCFRTNGNKYEVLRKIDRVYL